MSSNRMPPGEVRALAGMAAYGEGAIVSRTLMSSPAGTITLFAFDAGQSLSEHAAPYDALVHVLDGEADVTLGGQRHRLAAGDALLMPANVPHAVDAPARFKMLLVMLRAG